jgi:hypothetical protein
MKKIFLLFLLLPCFVKAQVIVSQPQNFIKYIIVHDSTILQNTLSNSDSSHLAVTSAWVKRNKGLAYYLIPGYGFLGTKYNGSSPQTFSLDTVTLSGKYEILAHKTATASSSTTTYPNWLGVENYVSSFVPTSLSATSPIFYNNSTGVISSQATSFTQNGYMTNGTQNIGGAKTWNSNQLLNDSTNAMVSYNIYNPFNGNSAGSRFLAQAYDGSGNNSNYIDMAAFSYSFAGSPLALAIAGQGFIGIGGGARAFTLFHDGRGYIKFSVEKAVSSGQQFSNDLVIPVASLTYSTPSPGIGMGTDRPNIARVDSFSHALTIQSLSSRAALELVDSVFTNGNVVGSLYGYAGHAVANTVSQIDMVGVNSNTGKTVFSNYNSGTKTPYLTGLANGTIAPGAFATSTGTSDSLITLHGGILGKIAGNSYAISGGGTLTYTITPGTGITGSAFNNTGNQTWAVSYGTTSTTAAVGNDSRINDGETAYTNRIGSFTTTGSSGAATFTPGGALNIPNYTLAGLGGLSSTATTLPSSFIHSSLTGVGTLSSGSIPYSLLTGTPTIPTQYWSRSSTTLSPATSGDNITTTGGISILAPSNIGSYDGGAQIPLGTYDYGLTVGDGSTVGHGLKVINSAIIGGGLNVSGGISSVGTGGYLGTAQLSTSISDNGSLSAVANALDISNNGAGYISKITFTDKNTDNAFEAYIPSATATSNLLKIWVGNANSSQKGIWLNGNGSLQLTNYGSGALTSDASGNITSVSDERLKHILGADKTGLKQILKLNTIDFKYNKKSGLDTVHTYTGFSAQNVKANIPNGTGITGQGYLTLQDRAIMAAMVNSIKELQAEITGLKKEVKKLKHK